MQFFRNPTTGLYHIFDRVGAYGWVFSVCGGGWEQVETFEAEIEKVSPLCNVCVKWFKRKEERERRKAEKSQQSICDTQHLRPPRGLNDLQKAGWYEAMGNDKRYEACPFCKGFKLKEKQ